MPLPKRKTSHARTAQRRANNWKIKVPNVGLCARCRAPRLSHHVCPSCGFYGNRMVIDMRSRTATAGHEAAGHDHGGHDHGGHDEGHGHTHTDKASE